jgi:hypothetical protein
MIPNFPHAYPIEWALLVVATVGAMVLAWAVWDAIKDSAALGVAGVSGPRMLIAMNNVRAEFVKLLMMSLLWFYGFIAITYPPPHSYNYTTASPEVQSLVEQIRVFDPRILMESDVAKQGVIIKRSIAILLAAILFIESLWARRVRTLFVRRMSKVSVERRHQIDVANELKDAIADVKMDAKEANEVTEKVREKISQIAESIPVHQEEKDK